MTSLPMKTKDMTPEQRLRFGREAMMKMTYEEEVIFGAEARRLKLPIEEVICRVQDQLDAEAEGSSNPQG